MSRDGDQFVNGALLSRAVTQTDANSVPLATVPLSNGTSALATSQVDTDGNPSQVQVGQKTAANSQSVVLASDTKRIEDCVLTATGEFAHASTITALVLPTITAKFVLFKARAANAGNVYVGLTGVSKADGVVDTSTGLELAGGDATPWIPATNLNTFFRACDNASDSLLYWVLS